MNDYLCFLLSVIVNYSNFILCHCSILILWLSNQFILTWHITCTLSSIIIKNFTWNFNIIRNLIRCAFFIIMNYNLCIFLRIININYILSCSNCQCIFISRIVIISINTNYLITCIYNTFKSHSILSFLFMQYCICTFF